MANELIVDIGSMLSPPGHTPTSIAQIVFPEEILVAIFAQVLLGFEQDMELLVSDEDSDDNTFSENRSAVYHEFLARTVEVRVLEMQEHLRSRQPLNVAGVCRRWRAIALSTPSLWASWDIVVEFPTFPTLVLLDAFVSRSLDWSGGSLLDFRLRVDPHRLVERYGTNAYIIEAVECTKSSSQLWSTIEKLSSCQKRWRKADIHIPSGFDLSLYSLCFRPWDLTALEEICMDCTLKVIWDRANQPIPESFSVLKRLELSVNNKHLGLHEMERMILGDTLEHLTICFEYYCDRMALPMTRTIPEVPLVKHGLRQLNFEVYTDYRDWGNKYIEHVLQFFRCPSLSSLFLSYLTLAQLIHLVTFLDQSGLLLTNLSLGIWEPESQVEAMNEAIVNYLRLVPSLVTLRFNFDGFPVISIILSALSQKSEQTFDIVPRLAHLEVEKGKAACIEFSTFITARWHVAPTHRSLKSVNLVRCVETHGNSRLQRLPYFYWTNMKEVEWKEVKTCVDEGLEFTSVL